MLAGDFYLIICFETNILYLDKVKHKICNKWSFPFLLYIFMTK